MVTDSKPDAATLETFEQVYRAYQAELRRFFRLKAHDPHAADDLMQTVYLQFLAAHPKSPIEDPQKYLFRIAWRVLVREGRQARNRESKTLSGDAHTWEKLLPRSTSLWIEDDTQTALALERCEAVIQQLPAIQQTVLLLQNRDNLDYKQIASRLGISTHTVKKYVSGALAAIRKQIKQEACDRGEISPGAAS